MTGEKSMKSIGMIFGCWLLAKTAYMIADFGHGPCGHQTDGVAQSQA